MLSSHISMIFGLPFILAFVGQLPMQEYTNFAPYTIDERTFRYNGSHCKKENSHLSLGPRALCENTSICLLGLQHEAAL